VTVRAREIHLVSRPVGWPTPEDFRLVEVDLAEPAAGQVLVRNQFLSVDPYMRGRMNDAKSYLPPYGLDEPMDGGAVGEVLVSNDPSLRPGDVVLHQLGWRDHAVMPARHARKVDVDAVPPSAYPGVLGMPGLTAYVGLTEIAPVSEGDVVFVSAAAGAVGSAAGQIARLLGAGKVIGSAGSPAKVSWLTEELGFDVAFDYHEGSVSQLLKPHGPVDVYFDNVGGDHLEGAITRMADFGRIAACGAISTYNAETPVTGPRNLFMVTSKRLTLRGYIVTDHRRAASEFYARAGEWVASGRLRYRETIVPGLDSAVDAFLGLHRGENVGKMVVAL
jgi:NADPH-dependent curcumin reductase CurA